MAKKQCLQCNKEYEAKRVTSKYCSAQCRKLAFQATAKNSVPAVNGVSVPPYEIVPDQKVYGRPAVKYGTLYEAWDLRPEPDSPDDMPVVLNRGKYERPDGSMYSIDTTGKVFEWVEWVDGVCGVVKAEAIENFGQPDCQCKHCQQNRNQGSRHIINHGPYKKEAELKGRELNRVALPGDPDFVCSAAEQVALVVAMAEADRAEADLPAKASAKAEQYGRSTAVEFAEQLAEARGRPSHINTQGQTQTST